MSTTLSNQNKMCATCDLWGGPRQAMPPYPSVFITVDSYSKGQCIGGGFNPMQVNSIATCGQWRKWGPLK